MAWTCKETEDTYNDIWFSVIANDIQGTFINEIAYVYKNCTIEQARKNAYLLAAAPDMYEALEYQCKNCLGRYSISKDSNECALYIRRECMIAKALRKARGEEE